MQLYEIYLTNGMVLVGRLKNEDDYEYHFVDVLKVMSTPKQTEKKIKNFDDLVFIPTLLPFKVMGEKNEIRISKNKDIY